MIPGLCWQSRGNLDFCLQSFYFSVCMSSFVFNTDFPNNREKNILGVSGSCQICPDKDNKDSEARYT